MWAKQIDYNKTSTSKEIDYWKPSLPKVIKTGKKIDYWTENWNDKKKLEISPKEKEILDFLAAKNNPSINLKLPTLNKVLTSLDSKNTADVNMYFELILESQDIEHINVYIDELLKIAGQYVKAIEQTGKDTWKKLWSTVLISSTGSTIDDTIELWKENFNTVKELFSKIWDSFGETWTEILSNWQVESNEDLSYINAIFSTVWDVAWLVLLDTIWEAWIVDFWGKILLKDLAFLLKNWIQLDAEMFIAFSWEAFNKHDTASISLLWLFILVHINYGYWALKRLRDLVVVTRWEKDSKSEKVKKKVRVTDDKWKKSTQEEMVDSTMKKLFWKYYIDAVTSQPVIFDINDNLSAEWNEFIKRKKVAQAVKSYFYDNPKLLKEFELIEKRSLQSNTNSYWRRTWRLLEGHGVIRKLVARWVFIEFFKGEKEANVLQIIEKLQKQQQELLEILYTRSTDWKIDLDKKTKFLEGVYSSINNNPNLTKKERELRLNNLEKLLNQARSERLMDKNRFIQEVYRIIEGHITKIEGLNLIEEEIKKIDSVENWWRTKKFLKWSKNKLLLKKHHLIRLKNRVAKWHFDGVTKEELQTEINKTIKSKFLHWGKNKKIPFPKNEDFIEKMENDFSNIETLLKLYDKREVQQLRNYIKYILPELSETQISKMFDKFEQAKSPYEREAFYQELNRIKEWFLPSHQLIEKLLQIKEDLEKENIKLNRESITLRGKIYQQFKALIPLVERNKMWKPEKLKLLGLIELSIEESSKTIEWPTPYKDNIKSLSKLIRNITTLLPRNLKYYSVELWSDLKSLSFSRWKVVLDKNITSLKSIKSINKIIILAREWKINLTLEQIVLLKEWNLKFDEEKFKKSNIISEDFTEGKIKSLKKELANYEWLEQYDYKNELKLGKDSSLPEIKEAFKTEFATELIYIELLNEWWEKLWDIRTELNAFAEIIKTNDLTNGQATEIEKLIFEWKKVDLEWKTIWWTSIDTITQNITDHSVDSTNTKAILTQQLRAIFEWIDTGKKDKIVKHIENYKVTIDKNKLPDFINQYEHKLKENDKKIEDEKEKNKQIETQKQNIQKKINLIGNRKNITQLEMLEKSFYDYIEKQNIEVESNEFKNLIAEFEWEYDRRYTSLETPTQQKTTQQPSQETLPISEQNTKAIELYERAILQAVLHEDVKLAEKLKEESKDAPAKVKEFTLEGLEAYLQKEVGGKKLFTVSTLKKRIAWANMIVGLEKQMPEALKNMSTSEIIEFANIEKSSWAQERAKMMKEKIEKMKRLKKIR